MTPAGSVLLLSKRSASAPAGAALSGPLRREEYATPVLSTRRQLKSSALRAAAL